MVEPTAANHQSNLRVNSYRAEVQQVKYFVSEVVARDFCNNPGRVFSANPFSYGTVSSSAIKLVIDPLGRLQGSFTSDLMRGETRGGVIEGFGYTESGCFVLGREPVPVIPSCAPPMTPLH